MSNELDNQAYAEQALSYFNPDTPEYRQEFGDLGEQDRATKASLIADHVTQELAADEKLANETRARMLQGFTAAEVRRRMAEIEAKPDEPAAAYTPQDVDGAYELTKGIEGIDKTWEAFAQQPPEEQHKFLDNVFTNKALEKWSEFEKTAGPEGRPQGIIEEATLRSFLNAPDNGLPNTPRARKLAEAALRSQQQLQLASAFSKKTKDFVKLADAYDSAVGVEIEDEPWDGKQRTAIFKFPGKSKDDPGEAALVSIPIKSHPEALEALKTRATIIGDRATDKINRLRYAYQANPELFQAAFASLYGQQKNTTTELLGVVKDMLATGFAEGGKSKEAAMAELDATKEGSMLSSGIRQQTLRREADRQIGGPSDKQEKDVASLIESLADGYMTDITEQAMVNSMSALGPMGDYLVAREEALKNELKKRGNNLSETYGTFGEARYFGSRLAQIFAQPVGFVAENAALATKEAARSPMFGMKEMLPDETESALLGGAAATQQFASKIADFNKEMGKHSVNPMRSAQQWAGARPDGWFGIDWSSATRDAVPELVGLVAGSKGTNVLMKGARGLTREGRIVNNAIKAAKGGQYVDDSLRQMVIKRVADENRATALIASLAMSSRAGYDVIQQAKVAGVDDAEAVGLGWQSLVSNLGLEYPMNAFHMKAILASGEEVMEAAAKAGVVDGARKSIAAYAAAKRKLGSIPKWAADIATSSLGEGSTEAIQFAADQMILRQAVRGNPVFDGWKEEAAAGFLMGLMMRGGAVYNGVKIMRDEALDKRAQAVYAMGALKAIQEISANSTSLTDAKLGEQAEKDTASEIELRTDARPITLEQASDGDTVIFNETEGADGEAVQGSGRFKSMNGNKVTIVNDLTGNEQTITLDQIDQVVESMSSRKNQEVIPTPEVQQQLDDEAKVLEQERLQQEEALQDFETAQQFLMDFEQKNPDLAKKFSYSYRNEDETAYDPETGKMTVSVPGLARQLRAMKEAGRSQKEMQEAVDHVVDEEYSHWAHDESLLAMDRRFFGDKKQDETDVDKKNRRERVKEYLSTLHELLKGDNAEAFGEASDVYGKEAFDALPNNLKMMEIVRMVDQQQRRGKQTEQVLGFYGKVFENLVKLSKETGRNAIADEAMQVGRALGFLKERLSNVDLDEKSIEDRRVFWASWQQVFDQFRKDMLGVTRGPAAEELPQDSVAPVVTPVDETPVPTEPETGFGTDEHDERWLHNEEDHMNQYQARSDIRSELEAMGVESDAAYGMAMNNDPIFKSGNVSRDAIYQVFKKHDILPNLGPPAQDPKRVLRASIPPAKVAKALPFAMPAEFPSVDSPLVVLGTPLPDGTYTAPTREQYDAFMAARDEEMRYLGKLLSAEVTDGKIRFKSARVDPIEASNRALANLGYSYRIPTNYKIRAAKVRQIKGFTGTREKGKAKETMRRYSDAPGGANYVETDSTNLPDTLPVEPIEREVYVASFDMRLLLPSHLATELATSNNKGFRYAARRVRDNYVATVKLASAMASGMRIESGGQIVSPERVLEMLASAEKSFNIFFKIKGMPNIAKTHIAKGMQNTVSRLVTPRLSKSGNIYSEAAFVVDEDYVRQFESEAFLRNLTGETDVKQDFYNYDDLDENDVMTGFAGRLVTAPTPLTDKLKSIIGYRAHSVDKGSIDLGAAARLVAMADALMNSKELPGFSQLNLGGTLEQVLQTMLRSMSKDLGSHSALYGSAALGASALRASYLVDNNTGIRKAIATKTDDIEVEDGPDFTGGKFYGIMPELIPLGAAMGKLSLSNESMDMLRGMYSGEGVTAAESAGRGTLVTEPIAKNEKLREALFEDGVDPASVIGPIISRGSRLATLIEDALKLKKEVQKNQQYVSPPLDPEKVADPENEDGYSVQMGEDYVREWGTVRGQIKETLKAIWDYSTQPSEGEMEFVYDQANYPLAIFSAEFAGNTRSEAIRQANRQVELSAPEAEKRAGEIRAEIAELNAMISSAPVSDTSEQTRANLEPLSAIAKLEKELAAIELAQKDVVVTAADGTTENLGKLPPKRLKQQAKSSMYTDTRIVREKTWNNSEVVRVYTNQLPGYHELQALIWTAYYGTGAINMGQAMALSRMVEINRRALAKTLAEGNVAFADLSGIESLTDRLSITNNESFAATAARSNFQKLNRKWQAIVNAVLEPQTGEVLDVESEQFDETAWIKGNAIPKPGTLDSQLPQEAQEAARALKDATIDFAERANRGMPGPSGQPNHFRKLWRNTPFFSLVYDEVFASYMLKAYSKLAMQYPEFWRTPSLSTFAAFEKHYIDTRLALLAGPANEQLMMLGQDEAGTALLAAIAPIFSGVDMYVHQTDSVLPLGIPSGLLPLEHGATAILIHRQYVAPGVIDPRQELTQVKHNRITLSESLRMALPATSPVTNGIAQSVSRFVGYDMIAKDESGASQLPEFDERQQRFVDLMQTVPGGFNVFNSPADFITEMVVNEHFRKALDLLPAWQRQPGYADGMTGARLSTLYTMLPAYSRSAGDPMPAGGLESALRDVGILLYQAGEERGVANQISAYADKIETKALLGMLEEERIIKEVQKNDRIYATHSPLEMIEEMFEEGTLEGDIILWQLRFHARHNKVELGYRLKDGGMVSIRMVPNDVVASVVNSVDFYGRMFNVENAKAMARDYVFQRVSERERGIEAAPMDFDFFSSRPDTAEADKARREYEENQLDPTRDEFDYDHIEEAIAIEEGAMTLPSALTAAAANEMAIDEGLEDARRPRSRRTEARASIPVRAASSAASAILRYAGSLPMLPIMAGTKVVSVMEGQKIAGARAKVGEFIGTAGNRIDVVSEPMRFSIELAMKRGTAAKLQRAIDKEFEPGGMFDTKNPELLAFGNSVREGIDDLLKLLGNVAKTRQGMTDETARTIVNALRQDIVDGTWLRLGKYALIVHNNRDKVKEFADRLLGKVTDRTWNDSKLGGALGAFVSESAAMAHFTTTQDANRALDELAAIFHNGIRPYGMRGRDYQMTLSEYLDRLAKFQGKDMEGTTKAYWVGSLIQHVIGPDGTPTKKLTDFEANVRRYELAMSQFNGNNSQYAARYKNARIAESRSERRFYRNLANELNPIIQKFKADKNMAEFEQALRATLDPKSAQWLQEAIDIFAELRPMLAAVTAVANGDKLGQYQGYLPQVTLDMRERESLSVSGKLDPGPRSIVKHRADTEEEFLEFDKLVNSGLAALTMRGEDAVRIGLERALMTIHSTIPGMVVNHLAGTPSSEGIQSGAIFAEAAQRIHLLNNNTGLVSNTPFMYESNKMLLDMDQTLRSVIRAFEQAKQADIISAAAPGWWKKWVGEKLGSIGFAIALRHLWQYARQVLPGLSAYMSQDGTRAATALSIAIRYAISPSFRRNADAFIGASSEAVRKRGSNMSEQVIAERISRKPSKVRSGWDWFSKTITAPVWGPVSFAAWLAQKGLGFTVGAADAYLARVLFISEAINQQGTLKPSEVGDYAKQDQFLATAGLSAEASLFVSDAIHNIIGDSDRSRRVPFLLPSRVMAKTFAQMTVGVFSSMSFHMRSSAGAALHKMNSFDPKMRQEGINEFRMTLLQTMLFHGLATKLGGTALVLAGASVSPILGKILGYLVLSGDLDEDDREKENPIENSDEEGFLRQWLDLMAGDALMFLPAGSAITSGLGAVGVSATTSKFTRALAYDLVFGAPPVPRKTYFPNNATMPLLQQALYIAPVGSTTALIDWAIKMTAALADPRKEGKWTKKQRAAAAKALFWQLVGPSNMGRRYTRELLKERPVNQRSDKQLPKKAPFQAIRNFTGIFPVKKKSGASGDSYSP